MPKKLHDMTETELRRKADQAWDMAGLARQDGDKADEARRIAEAKAYEDELHVRRISNG